MHGSQNLQMIWNSDCQEAVEEALEEYQEAYQEAVQTYLNEASTLKEAKNCWNP
jgi:hypothetical protein